ncbi:VCBS domain-containing protein [Roseibium sp. SCP14]|uniref:VCBS domain-containing protein n=1 Tax=Roseibium sp. SCP14 TaxID=3141375 RepID=UPI00333A624F
MGNNINLEEFFDSIRAQVAAIKGQNEASLDGATILGNYVEAEGNDPSPDVSSINFVHGTKNDDVPLEGSAGLDIVLARAGNDTLVGYGSIDLLLGSNDVDTIDYSYLNSTENGVFIDLAAGIALSKGGDIDLLSSIENAIGTVNSDILMGNGLNNIFFGNGGGDIIDGRGGSSDVAQFVGKAEDYDVVTNDDGSVSISKDGATTKLYNIELVQFADPSEDGGVELFNITDGALVAHDDEVAVTETAGNDDYDLASSFNILGNDDTFGAPDAPVITGLALQLSDGTEVQLDTEVDAFGNFEVNGEFGVLRVNAETGEAQYFYTSETDKLVANEKGTDTFVYQVAGGDKAEIKIEVTGVNDAPMITWDLNSNWVPILESVDTEGSTGKHVRGGVFEIVDPDTVVNKDNFKVGIHGEPDVTLRSDENAEIPMPGEVLAKVSAADWWVFDFEPDVGRVGYKYQVEDQALDFLSEGEILTIDYVLRVEDKNDPSSFVDQPVTVKIIGTNDQPEILVDQSTLSWNVNEVENANPQVIGELEGTIVVDDPDLGDLLYISIEGNGSPTYSEGELPDVDLSDLLASTNFDFGANPIENVFTIPKGDSQNVDFTYGYNGSANLDWLAVGETLTLTFDVKVSDRNWFPEGTDTTTITITITGTNDGPVITGGDMTGEIIEGDPSTLSDTGSISFTDLDLNDTPTASDSVKSVSGVDGVSLTAAQKAAIGAAFSIEAAAGNTNNGTVNWTYDIAEEKLDFLAEGEQVEAVFTITMDDGNGGTAAKDVTITITGTNDAPTVTWDINSNWLPILESVDTEGSTGKHVRGGVFEIVDPDTEVNKHNFKVDVHGDPDVTLKSDEDAEIPMPGDVFAKVSAADWWVFDFDPDVGRVHYKYVVEDQALDFLSEGDVLTIDYTLRVTDKNDPSSFVDQPVTVKIIGTNDQPEILVDQSDLSWDITEEDNANPQAIEELKGSIYVDDPDLGDKLYISIEGDGTPSYSEGDLPGVDLSGLLSSSNFDFGGTNPQDNVFEVPKSDDHKVEFVYNYDGSADLDWLAAGEKLTLTFDVKVSDRAWFPEGTDTTKITITVTGTNDGPVITGDDFAGAVEEANDPAMLEDTGTISFTDLDLTDRPVVTSEFTSVEPVGDGFVLTEDQKAAFTTAFKTDANGGNTNNGSATWTFAIAATALDFLAQGEQVEAIYTVTVTDDEGETDTRDVKILITGTNDYPVIDEVDSILSGDVTEKGVDEEGTDEAGGIILASDVDVRDGMTFTASEVENALGKFIIDPESGKWSYVIDDDDPRVQALNKDDEVLETYTVTVADNFGGTDTVDVTIKITGSNDAPTVQDVTDGTFNVVANDGPAQSTLDLLSADYLNAQDVDDGETETLQIKEIDGTLSFSLGGQTVSLDIADLETAGLLNINEEEGTVAFTRNLERVMAQALDEGQTGSLTGTATVEDVHGATDEADFDITLNVTPDVTNTFGSDDWTTDGEPGDMPEMLVPNFADDGEGPLIS